MTTTRRVKFGPIIAVGAMLVCVATVIAQPQEGQFPKTCTANKCVLLGSTSTTCEIAINEGCCCKFSGQAAYSCQCVDTSTCTSSSDCVSNVAE